MALIHITDRDIDILSTLGELGFLDTETLHRRFWADASLRACQKRLKLFQSAGLSKAVQLQVWYADGPHGRLPTLHCLTEQGAATVTERTGERPLRVIKGEPKPETLFHRLGIVKMRLAFDDACQASNLRQPQWVMEQDLRTDRKQGGSPSEHRLLYHVFRERGATVTCQPDAASVLRIPLDVADPLGKATDLVCFFEYDRSSEGVRQATAKAGGYELLLASQEYRRYFAELQTPAVRVFWVCKSRERIATLCQSLRDVAVARSYRFTTEAELFSKRVLLDPIWRTVQGEHRSVVVAPVSVSAALRDEVNGAYPVPHGDTVSPR